MNNYYISANYASKDELVDLANCTTENFETFQTKLNLLTQDIKLKHNDLTEDLSEALSLIQTHEKVLKSLNIQLTIQFILLVILLGLCMFLGINLI